MGLQNRSLVLVQTPQVWEGYSLRTSDWIEYNRLSKVTVSSSFPGETLVPSFFPSQLPSHLYGWHWRRWRGYVEYIHEEVEIYFSSSCPSLLVSVSWGFLLLVYLMVLILLFFLFFALLSQEFFSSLIPSSSSCVLWLKNDMCLRWLVLCFCPFCLSFQRLVDL